MFSDRMKALEILKNNNYHIAWGNGPPGAWNTKIFYFAVGTKDKNILDSLGFEEKEKTFTVWNKK